MNKLELKGISVVSGGEFDRGSAEGTMHKGTHVQFQVQ
jgi:hypothetical protein